MSSLSRYLTARQNYINYHDDRFYWFQKTHTWADQLQYLVDWAEEEETFPLFETIAKGTNLTTMFLLNKN